MVIIGFHDREEEIKALSYVLGRFPFKTWSNGEMMVPEGALAYLASRDLTFTVQGRPTYERNLPQVRDPLAAAV